MTESFLPDGYNAGYADLIYERYRRRPEAVSAAWAELFRRGESAGLSPEQLRAAAIAGALVEAYREMGHMAAHLDPLGSPPPGHPTLELEFYGLTAQDLQGIPAWVLDLEHLGETVAEALESLRRLYCGTIAYEVGQIDNPKIRGWLVEEIESGRHAEPLSPEEARSLLQRLTEVEGLEHFLHRSYLGQKRFSIEGLDMMVPMLDLTIELGARSGAHAAMIGMAHRGRLNVLAHVVGRPYEQVLAEFEGEPVRGLATTVAETGTGDVKYHIGADGVVATPAGKVAVTLAPNPSHLEYVNPVIEGMTRAAQTDREDPERRRDTSSVLPILIHGDAAFAAEGIVAETLNLSRLQAYETGGTVHIIANNQLGFTTGPDEGRSTRYASDLALGFRIPVVHVNADQPESCLAAVRLAMAYRDRWHDDIVIDLIGYRRYGHNEGDEPSFTQPRMYSIIDEHPTVRTLWAERLTERGIVDGNAVEELSQSVSDRLDQARQSLQRGGQEEEETRANNLLRPAEDVDTNVERELLYELNRGLHQWPDDFHIHPKLGRLMERRRDGLEESGTVDWAHAEALAFASLLAEAIPIRMSGQDTERGTFSQRHLVLHDVEDDRAYTPLAHLPSGRAAFAVFNSPLSEAGVLGFEYGYSVIASDALVLWEAQFGDFSNVAQAIIDLFIAAGRSKWAQKSGLVLLLPHAYEGQGPEHSSARLERFLQLAAEDNLRIANCTTPAQYFHILRRQARSPVRRPLVLLTPKSLLRHPEARSTVDDLVVGRFQPVFDDPEAEDRRQSVRRLIWCSGKIYYDLVASEARAASPEVAVARLEQLYPFPESAVREVVEGYSGLEEVLWVQEEPANMGARAFVMPRLQQLLGPGTPVHYVGRPEHASPAEGYASRHAAEQERIVKAAFAPPQERRPSAVEMAAGSQPPSA